MIVAIVMVRMENLRNEFAAKRAALAVGDVERGETLTDSIDYLDAEITDYNVAHAAKLDAFRGIAS
jgi:hypothetical protein